MGTPLPPIEVDPGVLCPECWGDDGPFEPPTPIRIFMALHNWSEGQFFNELLRSQLEARQELTQTLGFPCSWGAVTAAFDWFVEIAPGETFMIVNPRGAPGVNAFGASQPPTCQQTLDNEVIDFAGNIIFGGTASIYFGSAP